MTITQTDIDTLSARDIESLVASEIMGLECYVSDHGSLMTTEEMGGSNCVCVVRRYTEDIFSAMMVVRKLAEWGVTTTMQWKGKGRVDGNSAEVIMDHFGTAEHAVSEGLPMAICKAALRINEFLTTKRGK